MSDDLKNLFDKFPPVVLTCRWCDAVEVVSPHRGGFDMMHSGLCPECQKIDDPTRCIQCDARWGGGEPFHCMNVQYGQSPARSEYRCAECIDEYSRALWPEEEYGPYGGIPIPPPTGRPS